MDWQKTIGRISDAIKAASRTLKVRFRSKPPAEANRWPTLAPPEPIPADPAEHAVQFAEAWYDRLEFHCRRRMRELGIAEPRIGAFDLDHDLRLAAFHPKERTGGSNSPGARINLNSGALNPELLAPELGPKVTMLWEKSRLRDRIDAIIAHEHHESLGLSHPEAVAQAAETPLPIREGARFILRAIHERELKGDRG